MRSKLLKNRQCFTLPEVLIVIGIIGVVTAITVPALLQLINDKVYTNRKEVIEDRLIQGLNQLNTLDDGMNASQYESTEQFLRALSKYYKMTQICSSDNISKCFPYEYINYIDKQGHLDKIKVSELKNDKLNLNPTIYLAPAAFINAQGIPFLVSLNKNCVKDNGESIKNIPIDCLALMYDSSGANTPNKVSSDIVTYVMKPNASILDIFANVKIISLPKNYTPLKNSAYSNNSEYMNIIGVTCSNPACSSSNPQEGDYYAAAAIDCYNMGGRLPSYSEVTNIANAVFSNRNFYSDRLPHSLSGLKDSFYLPSSALDGRHGVVGVYIWYHWDKYYVLSSFNGGKILRSSNIKYFCVTD